MVTVHRRSRTPPFYSGTSGLYPRIIYHLHNKNKTTQKPDQPFINKANKTVTSHIKGKRGRQIMRQKYISRLIIWVLFNPFRLSRDKGIRVPGITSENTQISEWYHKGVWRVKRKSIVNSRFYLSFLQSSTTVVEILTKRQGF